MDSMEENTEALLKQSIPAVEMSGMTSPVFKSPLQRYLYGFTVGGVLALAVTVTALVMEPPFVTQEGEDALSESSVCYSRIGIIALVSLLVPVVVPELWRLIKRNTQVEIPVISKSVSAI